MREVDAATVSRSREDYMASVYGSAALAHIAVAHALDTLDGIMEELPGLVVRNARRSYNAIMGKDGSGGEVSRLLSAVYALFADRQGTAWVQDFGNAAYGEVEGHVSRLENAVALVLERSGIKENYLMARLLVSQSLAHEATGYTARRAAMLRNYSLITSGGLRLGVATVLGGLSCKCLEHHLTVMSDEFLKGRLPEGLDIAADPTVRNGCKAVLNVLGDVGTWVRARDKADKQNNIDNENYKGQ